MDQLDEHYARVWIPSRSVLLLNFCPNQINLLLYFYSLNIYIESWPNFFNCSYGDWENIDDCSNLKKKYKCKLNVYLYCTNISLSRTNTTLIQITNSKESRQHHINTSSWQKVYLFYWWYQYADCLRIRFSAANLNVKASPRQERSLGSKTAFLQGSLRNGNDYCRHLWKNRTATSICSLFQHYLHTGFIIRIAHSYFFLINKRIFQKL